MVPPLEPECDASCALNESSDDMAPAAVVKPQVHTAVPVPPAFERLYSREGSARETGTLRCDWLGVCGSDRQTVAKAMTDQLGQLRALGLGSKTPMLSEGNAVSPGPGLWLAVMQARTM